MIQHGGGVGGILGNIFVALWESENDAVTSPFFGVDCKKGRCDQVGRTHHFHEQLVTHGLEGFIVLVNVDHGF